MTNQTDDSQTAAEKRQAAFRSAQRQSGSRIELSLACEGVPKLDVLTKSDPFCIVSILDGDGKSWEEILRTETIDDTEKCFWVAKVELSANEKRTLKFEVYDRDSKRDSLSDHDFVGSCEFVHLASILEGDKKLILKLRNLNTELPCGRLIVAADAISPLRQIRVVDFRVGVDVCIGHKYSFQVSKQLVCGAFYPVWRSNSLERRTSRSILEHQPFEIEASKLCGGTMDRLLRIELFRNHTLGKQNLAGYITFSLEELENQSCIDKLEWQHPGNGENYKVSVLKSTSDGGKRVVLKVTLRLALEK